MTLWHTFSIWHPFWLNYSLESARDKKLLCFRNCKLGHVHGKSVFSGSFEVLCYFIVNIECFWYFVIKSKKFNLVFFLELGVSEGGRLMMRRPIKPPRPTTPPFASSFIFQSLCFTGERIALSATPGKKIKIHNYWNAVCFYWPAIKNHIRYYGRSVAKLSTLWI